MKIFSRLILFIFIIVVTSLAHAAPKIIYKSFSGAKAGKIISNELMPSAIQNFVANKTSQEPSLYAVYVYNLKDYFLIYELSGKSWSMTTTRVELNTHGEVKNVLPNFVGGSALIEKFNDDKPAVCPDHSISFVAISAFPNVAAVNEVIKQVSDYAIAHHYRTKVILSTELADSQTYKNWLACTNLKGFYTVGHGSNEAIMVGNGEFVNESFFRKPELANRFKNTILVINSCQVFNFPFGGSIMFGGSYKLEEQLAHPGFNPLQFIGGYTNLPFYSSERTTACFIQRGIDGAPLNIETLQKCIDHKNIHYQIFGIIHRS